MADPKLELFNQKKRKAKRAGILFTLLYRDIVWPEVCPIFNAPLDYYGTSPDYSPSFDRVYPNQGYTPENTVIVSMRANRIKNDAAPIELLQLTRFYLALTEQ